ncbi:capping complex subunit for YIEGIA [Cohnella thermotolerans]|jgi:hypothetical protein|uniref:capping complex subunit for YIEGIA n=1 Tax=Cohnella thermotolerans TaxID=329858 RepID=UPI0003FC198E|nr:hypothetical protein [Cohnella thermotolerans]
MVKIMAVVTTEKESVGGGAPLFYARDKEEMQELAHLLEKLLNAAAHQLNEHSFLIVYRG